MAVRVSMFLIFLVSIAAATSQAQSPILGILEEVPGAIAGAHSRRAVRVVFGKYENEWRSFPSACTDENCLASITGQFPHQLHWTVGFDGKPLGEISSTTPLRYDHYSDQGLQNLTNTNSVPTIGKRSRDFGGFTGESVYRPLVADSQPSVSDPDGWRPSQPSLGEAASVRGAFRQHFGKLCRLESDNLKALLYRDEDLKIVTAYKSRNEWTIARVHLEGAVDCADTEGGFEIDDSWFVVAPQMKAQHLDDGMWLVDAGDYDNDGHSELVFSIDRDNRGGYEIFYDNFRGHAVFEYSYH